MRSTVATTGFTEQALEALIRLGGEGRPGPSDLRRRAWRLFETLPMPSPETEEWRYTDVRELNLDLVPFADRPALSSLDNAEPGL